MRGSMHPGVWLGFEVSGLLWYLNLVDENRIFGT